MPVSIDIERILSSAGGSGRRAGALGGRGADGQAAHRQHAARLSILSNKGRVANRDVNDLTWGFKICPGLYNDEKTKSAYFIFTFQE